MQYNVRAKRATTAGRQARAGENVPCTARPGLHRRSRLAGVPAVPRPGPGGARRRIRRPGNVLPLPLGEGWWRSGAFESHATSPRSGSGLQAGTRTASEGRRSRIGPPRGPSPQPSPQRGEGGRMDPRACAVTHSINLPTSPTFRGRARRSRCADRCARSPRRSSASRRTACSGRR